MLCMGLDGEDTYAYSIRGPVHMINCVGICHFQGILIASTVAGDNMEFDNCTMITGLARAIQSTDNDGPRTFRNCYAHSTSADDWLVGGSPTTTNVATSDTTGPDGLDNIAYNTANFRNTSSRYTDFDARLALSGSALADIGADISADNTGITTDFQGQARDADWDIGADEVGDPEAAGGAVAANLNNRAPIFLNQHRRAAMGIYF
jgi:hypothetical protein